MFIGQSQDDLLVIKAKRQIINKFNAIKAILSCYK